MDRAREILALGTLRHIALPDRGVEIGLLDWGGQGPPALLHHANGFCKGVLGLLVPELRRHFRVFAMDARGHGDSTSLEPPGAYQWDDFALDVLAVAERLQAELGERFALGLGHSFGGTALLGAASRRPEAFERLVLVDPVTPPRTEDAPPERLAMTAELAERAERRRADWPDRGEARAWWAERPLFENWQEDAIDLYALDGLRERSDGNVELKCRGSVEAAVFRSGGSIDVASILRGLPTPALWLVADRGNFPFEIASQLASTMGAGQIERVDAGHLVPMERPDLVIEATLRFLETA
jgi:pimeloyl-ACP methyl ester carboxylesterase